MRLFVAVWPSAELADALARLERPPSAPGVRWTGPDQWHVTLRFLGSVPDAEVETVGHALAGGLAGRAPVTAQAGPAVERLGKRVACVAVSGLDDLAEVVGAATARFGSPPEERSFHGHLTVARAKGRARLPGVILGQAVRGRWTVDHVDLVASDTHPDGARYRVVRSVPLAL